MRAEYWTSGARACRNLACSPSNVSERPARVYGCHAASSRIPRTVLRSNCNGRAISDFERRSTWNSRCTSRQQSSRTMRPSPSGVTSGPVSAVAGVGPSNNVSLIYVPSLLRRGGEFSMTTDGDYWVTADSGVVASWGQRLQRRRLARKTCGHDLMQSAVHAGVGFLAQPLLGQLIETRPA